MCAILCQHYRPPFPVLLILSSSTIVVIQPGTRIGRYEVRSLLGLTFLTNHAVEPNAHSGQRGPL
jgi:hypothetical protein